MFCPLIRGRQTKFARGLRPAKGSPNGQITTLKTNKKGWAGFAPLRYHAGVANSGCPLFVGNYAKIQTYQLPIPTRSNPTTALQTKKCSSKNYCTFLAEKAGNSPARGNVAERQKGCRPRLAIEPW